MRSVLLLALVAASAAFADPPKLVSAARLQTRSAVTYDGSYARLAYPLGDVPAYRAIGIDLQVLVHEDMAAHFSAYPQLWRLSKPDSNVDHRRVPNLQRFLE